MMTSPESQRNPQYERRLFRYSLSTLLIAMVPLGVCLGYAVRYGLLIGIVFGAIAWWGCNSVVLAFRCWPTSGTLQRSKAILEVGAFVTLSVTFVTGVALIPCFVRQGSARDVQRALRSDARFSSVHIEYTEAPDGWRMRVEGEVQSDLDFDALRKAISLFDGAKAGKRTGEIWWDVRVVLSQREHRGWGYENLAISRR
jgi:hypothetical protein